MQGFLGCRRPAPFARHARARALVALFTLIVLGGLSALGLFVARVAGESVEATAVDGSEAVAATLVRVALDPEDAAGGRLRPGAFEKLARDAVVSGAVDEVRLWRRGAVLVRDARGAAAAGAATRPSEAMTAAFAGVAGSEVGDDPRGASRSGAAAGRCATGDAIRVFVPLFARGRPVREVLELCSAHAPVAAAAAARRRGLLATVLVGALLLWLVVLPAVLRAARLLAERADRRNRPLVRALRRAMRRDELALHFQPKLALAGGVEGVEALLRWRHPVYGDVPPLAYLPAAERTEVIGELTMHVLRLAGRQAGEWRDRGLEVAIAVNIAPAALDDPRLAADVVAVLAEHDVPPESITLEITESALGGNRLLHEQVEALAATGVRISIDDFGTGESSLGRLDRMPFDELKIDRVFIIGVEAGGAPTLLRAVIRLAHDLGLRTVAEGVESPEMVDCLRSLDCDAIQGFHISRPLPADRIEAWLLDRPGSALPPPGRSTAHRTSVRSPRPG